MALRSCSRFFRGSSVLCARIASASHETTSRVRQESGNALCPGRADGFLLTPVRFVSSDGMWVRLMKGKYAEFESGAGRFPASVPPNHDEQVSLLMRHPDEPENAKVLTVAIIGHPNAGKSTLSNQILGKKLFPVSKKVHTTRTRAMGVLTEEDTQIVLLDTPGMTNASKVKRHQLEKSLLQDPWDSIKEADLVVVLVDVSDRYRCARLDFEVLKCLSQHPDIPAVLVLNKVDLVKVKDRLLNITAELTCGIVNGHKIKTRPVIKPPWARKKPDCTPVIDDTDDTDDSYPDPTKLSKDQQGELSQQRGWPGFKDVFMLSSLDPEDVETLKSYFLVNAKPGEWQYHSEVLTDQLPEQICTNIIREKLLEYLPQEVPYCLTQSVELWQEGENGDLDIIVNLYAKKESHLCMVIGTAGQMADRISRKVSEDLSRIFFTEVRVKLSGKLRK